MSNLMLMMTVLLSVAMLSAGVIAIVTKNLPIAILSAGAISLFASVIFLILAAPDVAMTEAAIGSGLTTFLFFFVLSHVRGGKHD